MEKNMKKLLSELLETEKSISKIEYLIYVTYPFVNDKRLLFKILNDIKLAITKLISIILRHDEDYRKIRLREDPKENLRVFIENCAPRYGISERRIEQILELLTLVKTHQDSSMEFKRHEKIVILSEYSSPKTITLEEIKAFSALLKEIFIKTGQILNPPL